MELPVLRSFVLSPCWSVLRHVVLITGLTGSAGSTFAQSVGLGQLDARCSKSQVAVVRELTESIAVVVPSAPFIAVGLREQANKASLDTKYADALALVVEALRVDLSRQPGSVEKDLALDLSMLARIAVWRSELGQAKSFLECAISLAGGVNSTETAILQAQMADLQIQLRHWSEADALLESSLETLRNAGDRAAGSLAFALGIQANLRLANIPGEFQREWYDGIAAIYSEALAAYDRDPDCPKLCNNRAIVQTSLASVMVGSPERLAQARRLAQAALAVKLAIVGPANDSIATSFQTLARVAERQGDRDQAFEDYRRAIGVLLAMERERPRDAVAILSRIAEVSEDAAAFCERLGSSDAASEAIILYTLSVEARQRMRLAGAALPANYQLDLTRAIEGPYHRLANLLVDYGRLAEAEQVLSLLKGEELVVLLRGAQGDQTKVSGTHQQAVDYADMATKWVTQTAALSRLEAKDPLERTAGEQGDLDALRLQTAAQQLAFQVFIAKLTPKPSEDLRRWIDLQSSRLGQATVVDPKAFGIQYIVEASRLGIIVVSGGKARGLLQPVSASRLNQLVKIFRDAVKEHGPIDKPARELWKLLVEPVMPFLTAARPDTLLISMTGALRYLPFAALQDPSGRFLVEDYAIAGWADAGDGKPSEGRRPWSITALGLVTAWGSFDTLPNVEDELRSIVHSDDNPKGLIPGRLWFDAGFDRRRFEASLRGQSNIVHVASHFNFVPGHEDKSELVLGKNGETLSITAMRALDFGQVELLTLSACETALGGGYANGFEVEGLAAVVLQRRGKAVFASLWKIADASAAEFMKRFYAKLAADPRMPVALALRMTQIEFLVAKAKSIRPGVASPQTNLSRWSEPTYWAPFVLSGSWQ